MKKLLFLSCLFFSVSAYADSVGPIFPSTCSNVSLSGGGTGTWVNPSSGTVEDGNNATNTNATSRYLYCSGYDFSSIPAGVTITGFMLEGKEVYFSNTVTDNSVRLFQSGSPVGTDKAAGANWPFTTLAWVSYGGSTDLWGITPTRNDIVLDPLFGAGISAAKVDAGAVSYGMDAERLTIFFNPLPTVQTKIYNGRIYNGRINGWIH